jgi:formylglycine-generating enzyme required for sulfatase activity
MTPRAWARALALLAALAAPAWSQSRAASREKTAPPRLALIPGGEFWMGSPEGVGSADEHPRHKVYVSAFRMDRFDVTAQEYAACVKAGRCSPPGTGKLCNSGVAARAKDPVNCVSWQQAESYCESLGQRLPTEAEWEKAARGGAETRWSFGDDSPMLGSYAWYAANAGGSTHPVGMKQPNQYGLYDMAGNVWQWVWDRYIPQYYQASPAKDPQGPLAAHNHVLRGGSWKNYAASSRAAIRYWVDPDLSDETAGFRCAAPASGRAKAPAEPPSSGRS